MSRRFQDMHITRDDWTMGEWIAVLFAMAVVNGGIVLMAVTVGRVLHIH